MVRFARNVQQKGGGGVIRIGLPCERQKTWEDVTRRGEILRYRRTFRITASALNKGTGKVH